MLPFCIIIIVFLLEYIPCNLQQASKSWTIMKSLRLGVGTVKSVRILLIAKGYLPKRESELEYI